jgi:hypothetical protein
MKKFLIVALSASAMTCVIYFFAIDILIKIIIEREGSKALRAELDINSATFHLLPASLTLRGVQATNPQQPLTNLFQADAIALPLDLGELLKRKLIVEQLEIRGLRFAQPRLRSGAVEGLTPAPVKPETVDAPPDAQRLKQQLEQQHRGDLMRTQQDLAALRNDWQQRLTTLPSADKLSDYQFRAQSKDANNRARLRSELNEELANVRKLQDQFALDFERVQPQLNASQAGSGSAVQLAPGAQTSITGGLLAREFKPLLDHILGFVLTAPGATTAADAEFQQWQILVRNVAVDGEIVFGATPLPFIGTLENLTPQPRLFNVMTTFALHNTDQPPATFTASGNLDYRKLPLQNLRFTLTEFPLRQLPLSTQPPLRVTVENALADIQGLLSVTGNQIDINVLARFQNAKLQVVADGSPIGVSAAEALRNTRDFDLKFQASGDVNNPVMKLNSSLDTLLATAVNREVDLAIKNNAAPELAELRQLTADLQRIQLTLATTQHTLQDLLGE